MRGLNISFFLTHCGNKNNRNSKKKKVVTVSSFNEQFCISTMLHALLSLVSMKDVKFTADNAKKKDFFF